MGLFTDAELSHSLGMAVYKFIGEDFPTWTSVAQTTFRDFFTTGDALGFGTGPLDVLPVVQSWLATREPLHDKITGYPGHLLSTSFTPLLVWAMNEPWGKEVNIERGFRKWLAVATNEQSPDGRRVAACVALEGIRDVFTLIPTDRKKEFCRQAFDAVEQASPRDVQPEPDSYNNVMATTLAIGLGSLVQQAPDETGRDGETLMAVWLDRWACMSASMHLSHKETSFQALLNSALDASSKLLAMSKTPPIWWLRQEFLPMLQTLLPTDEYERTRYLPWLNALARKEPNVSAFYSPKARYNQDLLREYCPQLHAQMDMLAAPDDWASAASMLAWTDMLHTRETRVAQLSLPHDYENSATLD